MKKLILPLLSLVACLTFNSCNVDVEEEVASDAKSAELNQKTSATAEVTGLTRFKMANLAIPSGGLPDGKRFYTNGILRANVAYYPYGVMKENRNGIDRIRFYVKPTSPTQYLVGTPYPYHHRAEICRYPWRISTPLGTEEWLGFSYIFPGTDESFKQNQTPVSIFQNHDGVNGPPTVQLEIAYPGQLFSPTKPYYNTPLGGEIMIINNVRGIRWVASGVRVTAGCRLDIVIQLVYGTGSNGIFNVWINGKLQTWPGNPTIPAGNVGSTVFSNALFGGNSKLGLYHHQLRFKEGVDKNYAKSHSHMRFWMTEWNDCFRKPGDWDYKNSNAYSAVSTASYP
jgi:hypothetical protein